MLFLFSAKTNIIKLDINETEAKATTIT